MNLYNLQEHCITHKNWPHNLFLSLKASEQFGGYMDSVPNWIGIRHCNRKLVLQTKFTKVCQGTLDENSHCIFTREQSYNMTCFQNEHNIQQARVQFISSGTDQACSHQQIFSKFYFQNYIFHYICGWCACSSATNAHVHAHKKHCQRHNGPRNWLRDLD